MKFESKKANIYIGYVVDFGDGSLILQHGEETHELKLSEELRHRLESCNITENTFLVVSADKNDKVSYFRFTGVFHLAIPAPTDDNEDAEKHINLFVGKAAKITSYKELAQVSLPLNNSNGETDWYALNFWRGSERHPTDFGAKAELELTPAEGEMKPMFWATTYPARSFVNKNGVEKVTYAVTAFEKINS